TFVFLLGEAASDAEARELVRRHRTTDVDELLAKTQAQWQEVTDQVQITTPDRSFDILMNGWLLYQTLACRTWARAAFYQASGAYGFRDQLQDAMALGLAQPQLLREQILRAAGREFPEGDVQHWWLPHSGQGVRTRISDDRVWLAYGVAHYVGQSGDKSLLEEVVPFIEGPKLGEKEHDSFYQPQVSDEKATVYEHCVLALDQALKLLGLHGLPLMGTGDWNDGMNRVGEGGKGESVWLGWLTLRAIDMFLPFVAARDPSRAGVWRDASYHLREAIERDAWDGKWYRRA